MQTFLKNNYKIFLYAIFSLICIFLYSLNYKGTSSSDVFLMCFILACGFSLVGICLFKKELNAKFKIALFLIALAIFVSYPLFNNYLIWQHDINFHLNRIESLKEAISNFQIPNRINVLANNGYGYIASTMYPELFMYIPALLRVFNVSYILSYKALLFLINFVSIFTMYYCIKKISKNTKAGLIGAIIYAGANYRLECIFSRGAVGEALALAFLPIVILGLYEVLIGNRKHWYLLALGVTGVLQSHIISSFFLVIICAVFGIAFIKNIIEEKRYKEILIAIATVVLLNIWFIVPFLQVYFNPDFKIVINDHINSTMFYDNAVFPAQFFNVFDTADSYQVSESLSEGLNGEMNFSL